jgi:hypothetical protein
MSSRKLRAILGKSGVKKRSSPAKASSSSSSSRRPSAVASPPALQRQQSALDRRDAGDKEDEDEDFCGDRLEDHGLARALATDLSLRTVVQTMSYVMNSMFTVIPERGSGMNSKRTAEVLNFRRALPRLVTANHVQMLMGSATAAEKEIVELVRAGVIRRIMVQRRRGQGQGLGELLVLTSDLEQLVEVSTELDAETRTAFLQVLKGEEQMTQAAIDVSRHGNLTEDRVDRLIRAGFLTQQATGGAANFTSGLFARPEDRVTLMSLETVARAASGSIGAVGGDGAVHAAGGSGGGRGDGSKDSRAAKAVSYSVAVPGAGTFLKLASAALAHLTDLLAKHSRHREGTETWLRNRWDGGLAADEVRIAARKARGEYIGVLPGRTRKWRDFSGLAFDWVLAEALGAGVVEVFETGSVGRGVRLR